jgi:hypothetical protein
MPTPQVQTLTPTNIANGYIDIIVRSGNLGADGTKILTFRVTDNANATGPDGGALTITLDTTSPVITSIAPSSAGPSQAATETFTATFNESVYGVDASDFVLSSTGSASGSIASVTGFPGPFLVSVTGISGTGALRLDLKSSGTGIIDIAGNSLAGGYTSGGTRSVGPLVAPAPVPTMSEWAMIILGTMLAGGAALYIQRQQRAI